MGPLSFAKPLDVFELVRDVEFNKFDTSYDRRITDVFKDNNVAVEDVDLKLGEMFFIIIVVSIQQLATGPAVVGLC